MNPPGFFVRYHKPFEAVDPERWTLSVKGLVMNAQELTLPDVLSLDRVFARVSMEMTDHLSVALEAETFDYTEDLFTAADFESERYGIFFRFHY